MTWLGKITPETLEIYTDDELCQKRLEVHAELGDLSIQLAKINSRYSDCIRAMIAVSEELRDRGVDTRAVELATTYHPLSVEQVVPHNDEPCPPLQAIA